MTPFTLTHAPSAAAGETLLAGGTTVIDLMKLGTLVPERIVDLSPRRAEMGTLTEDGDALRIGALATMAEVARHPLIAGRYPLVMSALLQSASPQIRNMATVGGNLMQRTRCSYFRDLASACNKRQPGSGCDAIGGDARSLAILGTSSACIANYAGDLAVALLATDAIVEAEALDGTRRRFSLADLHRLPGMTPQIETNLGQGEVITAVILPPGDHHHSVYLKIRDRASYAFALASAAVSLELAPDGSVIRSAIALGGLASAPWRATNAERYLRGRRVDVDTAMAAGKLAMAEAVATPDQTFKIALGRRTLTRAILSAARPETNGHKMPTCP